MLDLNRDLKCSPFVSLTTSFHFALHLALKIRKSGHEKPIYIAIVDGEAVSEYHETWFGSDICKHLLSRRMLKEYTYKGKHELLVFGHVSPPCIVGTVDLEDLEQLELESPTVQTFFQLGLFRTFFRCKEARENLERPYCLDNTTGHAIGLFLSLVFKNYRAENLESPLFQNLILSILENYKVPERASWQTNPNFTDSLARAYILQAPAGCLLKRGRVSSMTPPLASELTQGPSPPNTGCSKTTIKKPQYKHKRIKTCNVAAKLDCDDNGMPIEYDRLSDIVGSDDELYTEALHQLLMERHSESSSMTLTHEAATNRDEINEHVTEETALLRPSPSEVLYHKESSITYRQAMLKSWLYDNKNI